MFTPLTKYAPSHPCYLLTRQCNSALGHLKVLHLSLRKVSLAVQILDTLHANQYDYDGR